MKDMLISGGENVYSVEVEEQIAQHSAVQGCAVIGVPDLDLGERVHAVIHVREGKCLSLEELQRHCRVRLAGYKIPRSLTIYTSSLPLTAANKVDKKALRKQLVDTIEHQQK
jgi:acyl-CoA synthetase (AMP-forming)/AMP-acid ligase II